MEAGEVMDKKPSWKKLETEYRTGNISIAKLAEKYGMAKATVQARSNKGQWSKKRKEYREKVAEMAAEKIAEGTAEKLKKEYEVACRMGEVLEKALCDEKQFYRHVDMYGNEDIFETLDTKRLSDAAKALRELTEIKKIAGNLISEFEDRKLQLEERKLRLSEERGNTEDNGEGGIIKIPSIIGEAEHE